MTRVVGSNSPGSKSPCPSFLPATRYTRPRLPSGGSLGSHFPTFSGTMLGYDYHLSFSMPYALARSPIPCLFLRFVSFLQARQRSGTLALTPGLLCHPVRLFRDVYKETNGPLKFPGFPFECMPRSPTPVVSSILAFCASRTAAFRFVDSVGFPVKKTDGYPMSTIIQISRLNHAAYILAPPGFGLPLPDLPARFATGLLAKL